MKSARAAEVTRYQITSPFESTKKIPCRGSSSARHENLRKRGRALKKRAFHFGQSTFVSKLMIVVGGAVGIWGCRYGLSTALWQA